MSKNKGTKREWKRKFPRKYPQKEHFTPRQLMKVSKNKRAYSKRIRASEGVYSQVHANREQKKANEYRRRAGDVSRKRRQRKRRKK